MILRNSAFVDDLGFFALLLFLVLVLVLVLFAVRLAAVFTLPDGLTEAAA